MPDSAFTWDQRPEPRRSERRVERPEEASPLGDRITLREAEHRFGVTVSTLRGWARRGVIDGTLTEGGRKWMVTPESIAHHLSHSRSEPTGRRSGSTGPTADGAAMLVPRDAWDRLMDQLGNLHEAGLQLAEARERAAKAETEATFLRERLGELRSERDELRLRADVSRAPAPEPASGSRVGIWETLKRWWVR
jgi:DNA-binding transcriptional MerR regulator